MRVHRFAAAVALWLAVAGIGFAQSPGNPQTPTQTTNESKKELKKQEKADKAQAKADKIRKESAEYQARKEGGQRPGKSRQGPGKGESPTAASSCEL